MTMARPITITLYATDETPLNTYSCTRVPVGIMLQAFDFVEKIQKIDQKSMNVAEVRAMLNELGAFIVDLFGDKFTLGELLKGSTLQDMVSVVTETAVKAGNIAASNPTSLPTLPKKPKVTRNRKR